MTRTTIFIDDRHAGLPAGELVDVGDERPLLHTAVADRVELETIGMVEDPDWGGAVLPERNACVVTSSKVVPTRCRRPPWKRTYAISILSKRAIADSRSYLGRRIHSTRGPPSRWDLVMWPMGCIRNTK
ncbi:MAG: hypothetical protein OXF50_03230 [Caldilineaceae bacterium]|nr:hypothetical protein [Caldilineaceae bacterium]